MPNTLSGTLVVCLEQALAAPLASCRLADSGARGIKVERPDGGDSARGYDSLVHGDSTYFVWANRGKESVALDLKAPGDMEILLRIIDQADVFTQNFAPGAVDRLGLGSATLLARNPRLITCDISGYGPRSTPRGQGLRPADPGRERCRLGHRNSGRPGANRSVGL